MSRRFSRRQRRILALLASGRCSNCNEPLAANFHADHHHPYSRGGPTILRNGQALCAPCNLLKANKVITTRYANGLREWQTQALAKALDWYDEGLDRHFVINAAPGAGKTRAAIVIAAVLLDRRLIERVVVIAPRSGVVDQWSEAFSAIVHLPMARLTSADDGMTAISDHLCATWAAVSGLADAFQAVCQHQSTLVICDEQHHAAITAAWGRSADSAFADARFVLILTGTPTRSDGAASLWLPHDDLGISSHPENGTYTLTYGEAVDLGYCRPATFHRHQGRFSVIAGGGETFEVTSGQDAATRHAHPAVAELQKSYDFYNLAKRVQFERDGVTPLRNGYHASMIGEASLKLDDLRDEMPTAGGLVIAPSIAVAEHFAKLIFLIEGERAIVVHSGIPNADRKIGLYRRQGHIRWLVSVGMVSEGIDIPRLRVLVLLPQGQTELVFRQALGRVVRSHGPNDMTRAYVVMPAWRTFEEYARRIEADMPSYGATSHRENAHRKCPDCGGQNAKGSTECTHCGHEFPLREMKFRICGSCEMLTPSRSSCCQTCGAIDQVTHVIELMHAERNGVIVRGISVEEADVILAEAHAPEYRRRLNNTADVHVLNILSKIPREMMPALASFFAQETTGRSEPETEG